MHERLAPRAREFEPRNRGLLGRLLLEILQVQQNVLLHRPEVMNDLVESGILFLQRFEVVPHCCQSQVAVQQCARFGRRLAFAKELAAIADEDARQQEYQRLVLRSMLHRL